MKAETHCKDNLVQVVPFLIVLVLREVKAYPLMGVGVLDVLKLVVMELCLLAQTHTLRLVSTLLLEPETDFDIYQ